MTRGASDTDTLARPTRGKTRPGRLRLLDRWLMEVAPAPLVQRPAPLVVDVGFGEHPHTTKELMEAARAVARSARVVGVENHPRRAQAAAAAGLDGVRFVQGAFLDPVDEPADLVRAMNVLRQYRTADAIEAHDRLGRGVAQGGWLLEGTSDKTGEVLAAHLIARRGQRLAREGLIFITSFARGFAPWMFRDVLPRDLRREVIEGEPIYDFFCAWHAAWEAARAAGAASPPESFGAAARRLEAAGVALELHAAAPGFGAACWRPAGGVPLASSVTRGRP